MPKLRRASSDETIKALERLGFTQVRQRGSHVVMQRDTGNGTQTCVVPDHRGQLAIGTLRSILRQADVSPEDFMAHL